MEYRYRLVLSAVGVGVAAALGVALSSQLLLEESTGRTVEAAVGAGVVATALFLVADPLQRALGRRWNRR
jgi:hypothetical protein